MSAREVVQTAGPHVAETDGDTDGTRQVIAGRPAATPAGGDGADPGQQGDPDRRARLPVTRVAVAGSDGAAGRPTGVFYSLVSGQAS